MSMIPTFLKELEHETATTHKMLERVPDDKYDWKPHEKSMTIKRLVTHIGEIPSWIAIALTTDELDFAKNPFEAKPVNNTAELLAFFESSSKKGESELNAASEETLSENWTMRNGEQVYSTNTKAEVIRMSLNQLVHHRAQLGVFLRLLNIPIPGSYGPSADEMGL